jgi:hypothetical protein
MTDPTLIAGDTLAPTELHAAAIAAFADYVIGPFHVTLAQWPAFLARHAVDLGAGRRARLAGRPGAVARGRRRGAGAWP